MNDTFSFRRLGLYAAKRYSEQWRTYFAGLCVLAAGLVLSIIFLEVTKSREIGFVEWIYFMPIAAIMCVAMVQNEMQPLRGRGTATLAGTLPCSQGERYVFALLNTTIGFLAGLMAVYYIIMSIYGTVFRPQEAFFTPLIFTFLGMFVSIVHGLAMLASTTRMRSQTWSFVVTTLVAMPVLGIALIPAIVTRSVGGWLNGTRITVNEGLTQVNCAVEGYMCPGILNSELGVLLICVLMTVMLWVVAYFRMRERQNG